MLRPPSAAAPALAALLSLVAPGAAMAQSAPPSAEDLRRQAEGDAAFACDLYRELAGAEEGNLFLSPHSISQALAIPPRSGDEAAVRIGANDTLTNDFVAGDYPGFGNRNIMTDGHVATVTVTTVG